MDISFIKDVKLIDNNKEVDFKTLTYVKEENKWFVFIDSKQYECRFGNDDKMEIEFINKN